MFTEVPVFVGNDKKKLKHLMLEVRRMYGERLLYKFDAKRAILSVSGPVEAIVDVTELCKNFDDHVRASTLSMSVMSERVPITCDEKKQAKIMKHITHTCFYSPDSDILTLDNHFVVKGFRDEMADALDFIERSQAQKYEAVVTFKGRTPSLKLIRTTLDHVIMSGTTIRLIGRRKSIDSGIDYLKKETTVLESKCWIRSDKYIRHVPIKNSPKYAKAILYQYGQILKELQTDHKLMSAFFDKSKWSVKLVGSTLECVDNAENALYKYLEKA